MYNPQCMTFAVAKEFYDLVAEHKEDAEFKVNRFKPNTPIYHGACFINFQYNVDLFGKHLCTVYQSNRVDDTLNFYDIEFNNQIYEDYFFKTKFKGKPGISDMIVARWQADEKKRKAEIAQRTNSASLAFLRSFQRPSK